MARAEELWERLVRAVLRSERAGIGTFGMPASGIAGNVSSSLENNRDIDAILRAADEIQDEDPNFSRIFYDITIAYKNQCPSFIDNVYGVDPSEVHMHIRRIPVDKILEIETDVVDWLMDTYKLKDHLLSDFTSNGHFPHQGTETELSTKECLIKFVAFIICVGIFIYLSFFSSIWFKVYIGLSCAYLTIATYFNVRAVLVLGIVKAMFSSQKTKM